MEIVGGKTGLAAQEIWWMWSDGSLQNPLNPAAESTTVTELTKDGRARVVQILPRVQLGDELPCPYLALIEFNI